MDQMKDNDIIGDWKDKQDDNNTTAADENISYDNSNSDKIHGKKKDNKFKVTSKIKSIKSVIIWNLIGDLIPLGCLLGFIDADIGSGLGV